LFYNSFSSFKVYVDYYPKFQFILNLGLKISIILIVSIDMINIIRVVQDMKKFGIQGLQVWPAISRFEPPIPGRRDGLNL
jgi:hypothetical protein